MAEDEVKESASAEDDWAAALAEQESTESSGDVSAADDWAAAMAEQTTADSQAAHATESLGFSNGNSTATQKGVFEQLVPESASIPGGPANLDMILDIPVNLTVELGRTKIAIRSLLQLAQGSVVELDGLAGEPMDVLVNGCLIAQGEVVVVNDKFGIRLTDIITPTERLRKLHR
ncbi:MAG: flagellar motor switch protein FliN [Sulfuricella sp.]|nr:flagellar motor switch protein FliN [Sulfuricella sp.]